MSNEKDFIKRPWGYYQIILRDEGYIIKKKVILPFQSISYQLHNHRSEHWVVVKGIATVTIDKKKFILKKGESTYIAIGVTHALENHTNEPLEIIEVQSGSYLGEDDIIRFQDKYGRKSI